MIGSVVSHYKILEKLGEGGMGVVYKAHDKDLDRDVALKFLPRHIAVSEADQARFLQEARAAAVLNHPNICTVHAIEKADDQQFIVMEYVDGKTLHDLAQSTIKNLQSTIGLAIQIGEALQEAHSKGIVHRDIKAENIMVNSKNQVKVMDFGLAKLKGSLKLTKTSSTVGTLAYMAPEQIQGGEVDARSDIFSFGVVLYEMLTGHLPFRGDHEAAMMYSIVNEEPAPIQKYLPDISSELVHIVNRALEKDPEDRYQTVHDVFIDLRRLTKPTGRVRRQNPSEISEPRSTAKVASFFGTAGRWNRFRVGIAALMILPVASILFFILKNPLVRLNPNRTTVTIPIPFKEFGGTALSRDGKWVLFRARDENGKEDVYWMNVFGGRPTRITNNFAQFVRGEDLSPDASQAVFSSMAVASHVYKVQLVLTQGGGGRILADTGCGPKWRPDGERIGYLRSGRGPFASISGRLEVWSVKPDGSDRRLELVDTMTTRWQPWSFCWSPDGTSIAWVRNYAEGYGEVMTRELTTGNERQLTFDKENIDEVAWTTNGQILYLSNKSGLMNLWMVPADGGEAAQITHGGTNVTTARISADNRTLIYIQTDRVRHIWISAIDGSGVRQAKTDNVQVLKAVFSPDGKRIAHVTADVSVLFLQSHLYVMDRDGNNEKQLTKGAEIVGDCIWSLDGKWLAYSSRLSGEPIDSTKYYLVEPLNPGAPRFLCRGRGFRWVDDDRFIAYDGARTLQYSLKGDPVTKLYEDSTFARPLQGSKQLLFSDFRKGREGRWVVSVDAMGKQVGSAKLLLDYRFPVSLPDRRYLVFQKQDNLWRVWISTGKEEKIGKAPSNLATPTLTMGDVSNDGKEILWLRQYDLSKMLLVKDVFE